MFWRAGRRSPIHFEHARLRDYGKRVIARGALVPKKLSSGERQDTAQDRIVLKLDS